MSRRALALVLLLLAACGDDSSTSSGTEHASGKEIGVGGRPGKARARAAVPTKLVSGHELVGDLPEGWTPAADDLALAARLGGASTDEQRTAAWDEIHEIEDASRVLAIVRAGLRLADPTAARTIAEFAASGTWGPMLDLWEQRRASALLVEAIADATFVLPGGDPPGQNDLFEIGGGTDLTALLDALARNAPPEGRIYGMSDLHKLIGRGHLPGIAALVASRDDVTAVEAWALADMALSMTDDDADAVADAARVHLSRDEPLAMPKPSVDPVGVVRVILEQRARLAAQPPRTSGTVAWAWRLLARTTPAQAAGHETDLQLIADEFEAGEVPSPAGDSALRLLLAQPGAAADDLIRRLVESGRGDRPVVQAARARRGDTEARKALLGRIAEADALAEALSAIPEATVAALGDALLGADEDHASVVLDAIVEADSSNPPTLWDRAVLAPIAHRAAASDVSAPRLARIALEVPFARTLEVGRAVIDRLNPNAPPEWDDADQALAFLETIDADAVRGLLRAWWDSAPDDTASVVVPLLRLSDATCGARLAEWVRTDGLAGDGLGEVSELLAWLARSDGPEVRDLLGSLARDSSKSQPEIQAAAVAALAICQGLPEDAAKSLCESLLRDDAAPDLLRVVRDDVFAGRVGDAVAHVLEDAPDLEFADVHLAGDLPAVRSYLAGLRERRTQGRYAWATAELALLGDAAALAETDAALTDGRYRWFEQLTWRQIARGDPVAAAPAWIERLAGNCCSEADVVGVFFDGAFGWEPNWGQFGSPTVLPVDEARLWWRRAGGRFVTSRIAGHLVPAPR